MAFEQRQWSRNGDKRQRQRKAKLQLQNIDSDMASSSIRETTGFKIQTMDVRNPP